MEDTGENAWLDSPSLVGAVAAAGVLIAWLGWTLLLVPLQSGALALDLRLARHLPRLYHRGVCRLFGLEVEVIGTAGTTHPTLFVANHCSYLDIPVLGSHLEASFIAKDEVGAWPLLGLLARLQRSVFIARRPAATRDARREITRRLAAGDDLVLFPEGTTSDGNRVLAFYSALFSLPRDLPGGRLDVQPVTLAYTRENGMPIGHVGRARYAWFGDMALASHVWQVVRSGRVTVEVRFHAPLDAAAFASRKALSRRCHAEIAAGLERALHRPAAPAVA